MSRKKSNIKNKKKKESDDYDNALKSLFSHPIMMESLIKGFVPQEWVKDLDFSSLRSKNVEHVTADLRNRKDDLIWAIEFKGKPLYIVCLLEFQSHIERFMSVRMLTYAGLIYQDLIKKKRLIEDNYLPPVFSLVFYTGRRAWNAPTLLKECLFPNIPESLKRYQPNIEYMTLDVGQINLEEYNLGDDNLVTSFIEFEKAGDLTNIRLVVDKLIRRLKIGGNPELRSVRRAFVAYINRVWKSRERFPKKEFESLDEVSNMLSERLDEWENEKVQVGVQIGVVEGEKIGFQKGAKETAYNERLWMITKLINHKFPKAPARLKSKLAKYSSEQLALLIDKVLNAKSIEELLEIEVVEV